MEKLIELLNEYNFQEYNVKRFFKEENVNNVMKTEWIISKRYGFIKWLVENDKIDRVQKTKEFRLQIELDNGSYGELGGEARLLMLLSISDTPIDDLCRYLKDDATEEVDTLLKGIKKSCESLGL